LNQWVRLRLDKHEQMLFEPTNMTNKYAYNGKVHPVTGHENPEVD